MIEIDGKNYIEMINRVYEIKYEKIVNWECPNTKDDLNERKYLLSRIDECVKVLKKDRNSRRATFANLYDNNLCKCISLVCLFIRDGKLNINEVYRSQDKEKNYDFDCQTAIMLMDKALKKMNDKNLKPGKITVFCFNFHKQL